MLNLTIWFLLSKLTPLELNGYEFITLLTYFVNKLKWLFLVFIWLILLAAILSTYVYFNN